LASLRERLEEMSETMSLFDDMGKMEYLVDLAKKSPGLDPPEKSEVNRVSGCASNTWVVLRLDQGLITLRSDSEAMIVKGMLAVLEQCVNGQPAAEFLKINEQQILEQIGLGGSITNRRINGLASAIIKLKQLIVR